MNKLDKVYDNLSKFMLDELHKTVEEKKIIMEDSERIDNLISEMVESHPEYKSKLEELAGYCHSLGFCHGAEQELKSVSRRLTCEYADSFM